MKINQLSQQKGQTFVFFLVAFLTIFLICGLAIDTSLIYLSKARLSRAIDAAVITGIQNSSRGTDEVARIMRNVAAGSYVDLAEISQSYTKTPSNPQAGDTITYTFDSASGDTEFVVKFNTGAQGQITRASAAGSVPHNTVFMGAAGIPRTTTLAATGEAVRRPRMITLILDRSGSMRWEGATNLADAVTNFLGLDWDTNVDFIGIVSYSAWARVEVPHSTNFNYWERGTNKMYQIKSLSQHLGGMKFNGLTAGGEGMRLGYDSMRTNSQAYLNPETQKYIIFLTDGLFNTGRELFAAPPYTNVLIQHPSATNGMQWEVESETNRWALMPFNEPVAKSNLEGVPVQFTETNSLTSGKYPGWVSVWLMPGSVLYHYPKNASTPDAIYISGYTNQHRVIRLDEGESNMLVMPGYMMDGLVYQENFSSSDLSSGYNKSYFWPKWEQNNFTSRWSSSSYSDLQKISHRARTNTAGTRFYVWDPNDADWNNDGTYGWTNQPSSPPTAAGGWSDPNPSGENISSHYPRGHWFFWENGAQEDGCISTNMLAVSPMPAQQGVYTFFDVNGLLDTEQKWKNNAPSWLANMVQANTIFNQAPTGLGGTHWRPLTYKGIEVSANTFNTNTSTGRQNIMAANATNYTGGWFFDHDGKLYFNSMALSSKPSHFYDFLNANGGRWERMTTWRRSDDNQSLAEFQAEKIAELARSEEVTIYTVRFKSGNETILKKLANDRTASTFDSSQPEGKYYYATSGAQIKSYFKEIAETIRSALVQ